MRQTFQRCAALAVGAALVLGACSDHVQQPFAPDATQAPSFNITPLSGHLPDELYLIDNVCQDSNPSSECTVGFRNGSVIYTVTLTGGNAQMTEFFRLQDFCVAGNPAINCSLYFDQSHIGATPDGRQLWVVQRRPEVGLGLNGNPAGYLDLSTTPHQFVYRGVITGVGPDGLVLVGFSPSGDLFVANQNPLDERLYRVNPTTLVVQESWQIRIGSTAGPLLDIQGADIAFDAAGRLLLYTNRGRPAQPLSPQLRGLYEIQISGSTAIATHLADRGEFFTGLAFRAAGTGNLVLSGAFQNRIVEVNPTTGALIQSYPMVGDLTDHRFGDMTTGRLFVAAPLINLEKHTNGEDADTPTGPLIVVGDPVLWEYFVTNTGNVPLTNVTVTDDQSVVVSCPKTTLAVGETMTCTGNGTAVAGQYANLGTATGQYNGQTVQDTDPSHYFGVVEWGGETATGAGFPWSATQGAPNNWFMYTPWSTTSGHRGISASAGGGQPAGTNLIAGQHHIAGRITGTRTTGGNGSTSITITLNQNWRFADSAENVKIHPMSCTTNQPYVSPGGFTRKVTQDQYVNGNLATSVTVTGLPNTACYGIHVDVERRL